MNPDIFLDDFERTEHSDSLHAILGRALIIATRFDAMCKAAALHAEIGAQFKLVDEEGRSVLLEKIADKYQKLTLSASIRKLEIPKGASLLLNDAKDARNFVAHDLAKGMTGCLDTVIDEPAFIREVSDSILDLAYGDVVISHTLSGLNREPPPNVGILSSYVDRVVRWVVEA